MKPIAVMIAALSLVTTSWAQGDHTSNGRRSKPMQTVNDSRMVAPALEKYAQGPLAELWKRPGLTPRDRTSQKIVGNESPILLQEFVYRFHFRTSLFFRNGGDPRHTRPPRKGELWSSTGAT